MTETVDLTKATMIVPWRPWASHWHKCTDATKWKILKLHCYNLYGWEELPEQESYSDADLWLKSWLLPWALGKREATMTVEWCMSVMGSEGMTCKAKYQHWKFDAAGDRWLSNVRSCGLKHCRYCLTRMSNLHAAEAADAFELLGYTTVYRYEFTSRADADLFCKNMNRSGDVYLSAPYVEDGQQRVGVYTSRISKKHVSLPCDKETLEGMMRNDLLNVDPAAKCRTSRNKQLREAIAEIQQRSYDVIEEGRARRETSDSETDDSERNQAGSTTSDSEGKEIRRDRYNRPLAKDEIFVHQHWFVSFMTRMGLGDGLDLRGQPTFRPFKESRHSNDEIREYRYLAAGGSPDDWAELQLAHIAENN